MKKYIPYIAAIIIFILISVAYFYPVLEGKRVSQGDNIHFTGMSKEIVDYRAATGQEALWTNSMFGGMPAFQISTNYSGDLTKYIDKIVILDLPFPIGLFFLYFLGFFILLLVLEVDPWISIAGAIMFAFSSYFMIIIEAGHNSKVHAIGYMASVIAGIILTLKGKYFKGGILTALALALELNCNHPQIAYYMFFVIGFIIAGDFVNAIIEKHYNRFVKAIITIIIASFLGFLPNAGNLLATYQYGKYTIRGKSELTFDKQNHTSGLDKDYATDWSYGIGETFSLMVPNIKGGVSKAIGDNESALKDVDPKYRDTIAQNAQQYWGDQPFTSGPVYAGAIVIFLFVLGLFIVKGKLKWVLLLATVLSIILAWGKNFMGFTNLFLDYFPFYNKFRAVSMILVIAEFTIPLLAMLALNEIIKNPQIIKQKKKEFIIALSLTGGLCLLFYLIPSTFFDFISGEELRQVAEQKANPKSAGYAEQIDSIYANIQIARVSIFKADVMRSFLFILISAACIWLYSLKKITKPLFVGIFILLVLADMYTVDRRYLNQDSFVDRNDMEFPFKESRADASILKDNSLDYRVYNISKNPFTDAETSYYHKSIGGYHGAKLKRYQELIEYRLDKEKDMIKSVISGKPSEESLRNSFKNLTSLNMLNTKYIIYNPDAEPLQNPYALGNAWFVNNYQVVDNADAEITAMNKFNPATTALIDKRFYPLLNNFAAPKEDSTSFIKLLSYKPNELNYKFNSDKAQMTIFSEIYYNKGWDAFIDDKPAPYFRADYVLRAMIIPAGEHNIKFKFEPAVYYIGNKISLAGSLILIISVIGWIFYEIRKLMTSDKKPLPVSSPKNDTNIKPQVKKNKK